MRHYLRYLVILAVVLFGFNTNIYSQSKTDVRKRAIRVGVMLPLTATAAAWWSIIAGC